MAILWPVANLFVELERFQQSLQIQPLKPHFLNKTGCYQIQVYEYLCQTIADTAK